MLTVIARYEAQSGMGDLVATTLAKHVAATRTEPGCVQFVAYRSRADRERFLLYEQYADDEAFEAHRKSPHFRSYVEGTIVPLLLERKSDRYDEVEPDRD
ncbi:MAG TPA: putative quinol monooxygenase [Acidimicrobiales bacterium]|nr:putative quinol monooxygenase [Acidimicrobiales bacterium]